MNKNEFIKLAKEYGYTKEEIAELVELHEGELKMPYEDIELDERIVD